LKKYHHSLIEDGAEISYEENEENTSHEKSPILNQTKSKKMQAESVVGTYYYMAPEVLQHEKYNATADWYVRIG
jgi:serine/threonine protein kinase